MIQLGNDTTTEGEEKALEDDSKSSSRRQLFWSAQTNTSPHDDSEEASERFLRRVDRVVPRIKLEVMGVNLMHVMLATMWMLGIFNLVVALIIVVSVGSSEIPTFGESDQTVWSVMYIIEGITRTLGVILLLLLFLAFPQRIFFRWYRDGIRPLSTQLLVILIAFLMIICPCYNLYQAVAYWRDVITERAKDDDGTVSEDQSTFTAGLVSLLYPYSARTLEYNTITSMIVLATLFVVFGGVFHQQYYSAKQAESELHHENIQHGKKHHGNRWDDDADLKSVASDYGPDDEEEAAEQKASREAQLDSASRAKNKFLDRIVVCKLYCRRCGSRYMDITGWIPWYFQFGAFFYLVMLIVLPIALEFHPSTIPVVSLITVGRICALNVSDYIASNFTLFVPEPIEVGNITWDNFTIDYQLISSLESDELGICSPGQNVPQQFRRSMACALFALLELYLFICVYALGDRTKKLLYTTSYTQTRREILGYYFFRHIALVCWSFIMIVGVLSVSVNPEEMYTVEDAFFRIDFNTRTVSIRLFVDPLFQVGVGMGTLGFGSYFVMVVIWIILLAFAYLPPDSIGFQGWFVGVKVRPGDEKLAGAVQSEACLISLARESDVQKLLNLQRRQHESVKEKLPRMLRRYKSTLDQVGANSSPQAGALLYLPPLISQIKANFFVLETEILNFHFMHLSYTLAGKVVDATTNIKRNLTREEQCLLVEDKRFTLLDHITDVSTDTLVMVFSSSDRVVVAFRGSVSRSNWYTNFDSSEVVCDYVVDVEPDMSDVPAGVLARAKVIANRPPKVHGGFVKAYETVRERVTEICRMQMKSLDEPKVLFVTGHSLGGGLACLCAADLAVQLRIPPVRIAVTTWGAPKVGTYSFFKRFSRLVPSARRFVMADDPITKLPLDPFFKSIRLSGWWHCGTEVLLNEQGTMLIRPTPIERFISRRSPITNPLTHLRMTYATSLMLWIVRSNPDYEPDWWASVVSLFYKNATRRLRSVPKPLREKLLDSLLRVGVTYKHGKRMVRDMMADTSFQNQLTSNADSGAETITDVPLPLSERNFEPMVTELLIALRLKDAGKFNTALEALIELRAQNSIFATPTPTQSAKTNGDSSVEYSSNKRKREGLLASDESNALDALAEDDSSRFFDVRQEASHSQSNLSMV